MTRVPHNKGVTKNPMGHSHAEVDRTCKTCACNFKRVVRNITRGGGIYCSRKCNPAYAPTYTKAEKARRHNLKRNYSMTVEAYDTMVRSQNNLCAICNGPPGGKWGKLCVDHDHQTGAVRQLLCISCNRALGWFRDNDTILLAAVDYLRKHARAQEGKPDVLPF